MGVADKLLHHIRVIQEIRDSINLPIYASQKSGFRSVGYEKSMGRSGNSEHTFSGGGAVDWTCSDVEILLPALRESEYTRVAYYPNKKFIHCDFKGNERLFFVSSNDNKWIRQ